jgi:hypothetical protein
LSSLDGQQVEVLGRSALIAALVTDGLEIAQSERDAGIDLLAYTHRPWRVVPIQMKAASGEVFSIDRKYEPLQGLVMAYVWNARSAETVELYALPWTAAVAVADDLGWTATQSWEAGGKYSTSRPSARVRRALAPHRMRPGSWRRLLDLNT